MTARVKLKRELEALRETGRLLAPDLISLMTRRGRACTGPNCFPCSDCQFNRDLTAIPSCQIAPIKQDLLLRKPPRACSTVQEFHNFTRKESRTFDVNRMSCLAKEEASPWCIFHEVRKLASRIIDVRKPVVVSLASR